MYGVLSASMSVHHTCLMPVEGRRGTGSSETGLTVVNHNAGAGN